MFFLLKFRITIIFKEYRILITYITEFLGTIIFFCIRPHLVPSLQNFMTTTLR